MIEEVRYSQNQLSAHSRRIALLEARITPKYDQQTTSPGNSSELLANPFIGDSDHGVGFTASTFVAAAAMNADQKNNAKNANSSPPSQGFLSIVDDSVVIASRDAKNYEQPNNPPEDLELPPPPTIGHHSSGSGSGHPPSCHNQQTFVDNPLSVVDENICQQFSSCVSNESLHPFSPALYEHKINSQIHQNQSTAPRGPEMSNCVNQIVEGDHLGIFSRQPLSQQQSTPSAFEKGGGCNSSTKPHHTNFRNCGDSTGFGNVMLPVSSNINTNNYNDQQQQQMLEIAIASPPSSVGGFSGSQPDLARSIAGGSRQIRNCAPSNSSTTNMIMSNGDVVVDGVAAGLSSGLLANQPLLHQIGNGLGEPPMQPLAVNPDNATSQISPDKLVSMGLNGHSPVAENSRKRKNNIGLDSEVQEMKLPKCEPRKINEFFATVHSVSSTPTVPSGTPQIVKPGSAETPGIVPHQSCGKIETSGDLDGGRINLGSRSTAPIVSHCIPLNNPVALATHAPSSGGGEASLPTVSLMDDAAQTSLTGMDLDEAQRLIEAKNMQLESLMTRVSKGVKVTKQLLIEQCLMERKEAQALCIENNRRLGRYRREPHGDQYVDEWVDGVAFKELDKKQVRIAAEREELDRQKKLLIKRKPSNPDRPGSRKLQAGTTSTAAQAASQSAPSALDDVVVPETTGSAKVDNIFAKPDPPKEMTIHDYYEADEILKLRVSQLKKEEAELQQENERLERERNLHVRESKRLQNEDQSKYKDFAVLGNNERYLLLSLLGKGGSGEVYRAFDLEESRFVACKIHRVKQEWNESQKSNYVKRAMREKDIHKKMDHPRIVQLYDVFTIDKDSFCTVLEYCDGHDLDFYLKQHKCIPEKEARSIIMQLVSALHYLNLLKPSIIHYDLKPANVLLSKGAYGEIKVTDFGLSKKNHEGPNVGMELTSQFSGTFWYLPPETFLPNGSTITSKVDVWSVGVIFYQCLYGERPFGHHLSQQYILENKTILNATEVTFPNKPVVSNDAKKFIRCCLQYRQEDRYDVMKLYNHDYLRPKSALRSGLSVGGGVAGNSLAGASAATSAAANLSPELPCTPAFPVAPHTAGAYQTHHQQQQNVDRVQQTAAAGRITDGGGGNVATTAADCSTASTANGGASGSQLSLG